MTMQAKKIEIDVRLTHADEAKTGKMSGYAYIDSGFLSGQFTPIDGNWSRADRLLMTAFTFTGCPIAARTSDPDLNPWRWTSGSYHAKRNAEGDGFSVTSRIEARGLDDAIMMDLDLTLVGSHHRLQTIGRPFQEAIKEYALGHLAGRFTMEFLDEVRNPIELDAVTEYRLEIDRHVSPAWRNITIGAAGGADQFAQFEQIDLFHSQADARGDLEAKCRAVR